jgi:hypothetical protein
VPATAIRCHDAEADAVTSDHVTDTSVPVDDSQRMPIRSGTVAPDASANASYSVPAVTGYEETVRACISPAATDVNVRQPSPDLPPVPLLNVQFSLAVQPEIDGSMLSVAELRKFPGIAKRHLLSSLR